jgi:hypothetical protein
MFFDGFLTFFFCCFFLLLKSFFDGAVAFLVEEFGKIIRFSMYVGGFAVLQQ